MPPKPRAARSARGGREGAAASRSTTHETQSTPAPQSTEPATTSDAPAQPVVLKHDDGEESKPTTTSESTLASAAAQDAPPDEASASATPVDGTDSPGRAPVQRLGSLNASRSASPAVRRGTSTRGKRGMIKPTFTGRRSKEERAALEKEAIEREKARTKEQADADRRKRNEADRKAKREQERASRGRGGYSGAMSGPFSLGSSRDDRKANHRTTSGFGAGSGSRATRIKNEDGGEGSSGYRGSGSGGGGRSSGRREGGGMESSEDEEDAEFPRKDIDLIEISSDENEAAPIARPLRSALPVRIGRKEHQERSFGINTDASTETSAKILEQAEAAGKAPSAAALKQVSGKGKGKMKESDITSSKKPFKGVWQDSDELTSPVKTEENSEDEQMIEAEQVGIVEQPEQTEEGRETPPEAPTQEESRPKARPKSITEPVLQTDEDRAEWARFQSNLSHIRTELGPDDSTTTDATGDVNMADGSSNARKPTVRDNNVYLFQIPPLMPELFSTTIKKEPSDAPALLAAPTPATGLSEAKIKVEEGFTDQAGAGHEAPRFASGCVGKLRVRQSGRTTLDWGGTSYELTPGNKASFLQEVVSLHVVPDHQRVVPEDAGDAISFGRVKGKFVVIPDWGQMLG
ncbi:RNA polymerase III RPC4-domain-containing protein [Phaeosphaeria sp. MPI-PUGE-AT-0046c]|nr:RNA polymerase III RPC4-domain-containing protein [Phaeosphaeria sp. MPI-PUGE-AT-0046c]